MRGQGAQGRQARHQQQLPQLSSPHLLQVALAQADGDGGLVGRALGGARRRRLLYMEPHALALACRVGCWWGSHGGRLLGRRGVSHGHVVLGCRGLSSGLSSRLRRCLGLSRRLRLLLLHRLDGLLGLLQHRLNSGLSLHGSSLLGGSGGGNRTLALLLCCRCLLLLLLGRGGLAQARLELEQVGGVGHKGGARLQLRRRRRRLVLRSSLHLLQLHTRLYCHLQRR